MRILAVSHLHPGVRLRATGIFMHRLLQEGHGVAAFERALAGVLECGYDDARPRAAVNR